MDESVKRSEEDQKFERTLACSSTLWHGPAKKQNTLLSCSSARGIKAWRKAP